MFFVQDSVEVESVESISWERDVVKIQRTGWCGGRGHPNEAEDQEI